MMFKNKKLLVILMSLMLALTVLAGCSQPAQPATQPEKPPVEEPKAPTVEDQLLGWADWSAKMSGTINKDYYVVDLRTPDEIKLEKALEGSINIDANETLAKGNVDIIDEKLAGVAKDAVILVHCKSGGRVKANLQAFLDKGYVNTFGLAAWTAFDTKGYFSAAKVDSNANFLKPEAWEAKMTGEIGKDYYVLDVRDKKEYDAGHIKGAINVGVRDQMTVDHQAAMAAVASAIPSKDAAIIIHCAVGKRAKVAAAHLAAEGYTNVVILDNVLKVDASGKYSFE